MKSITFALLLVSSVSAAELTVNGGASFQSKPENGTWWDQSEGITSFRQISDTVGVGVKGNWWAVEIQDLGHETSHYVDQNGRTWDGLQHPRGIWAFVERGDKVFMRAGLGVYRPRFSESISPPITGATNVANNNFAPSYDFGVGYKFNKFDAILDVRYTAANGNDTPGNFIGLGKFSTTAVLRYYIEGF